MNNGLSSFPEAERTQDGVGPGMTTIVIPDWQLSMRMPADAVAGALQVYTVLRGFSWQIRLAPFSFEALLAAVVADDDSVLRDQVRFLVSHLCTLSWCQKLVL